MGGTLSAVAAVMDLALTKDVTDSALAYFLTADFFILLCITTYLLLPKLAYSRSEADKDIVGSIQIHILPTKPVTVTFIIMSIIDSSLCQEGYIFTAISFYVYSTKFGGSMW